MQWIVRKFVVCASLILASCAGPAPRDSGDGEAAAALIEPVDPACFWPSAPDLRSDDDGYVLKVWRFPLEEVHTRPVLPDEPGLLAYRAAMRSEGRVDRYPLLYLPPARNDAEAIVWRDEGFNNELAYAGGAGSIEPITCLDALLFAEQNARIPQLQRPTEFVASVLRKGTADRDEVVVVFGAGNEMFPSAPALGFDIVDAYLARGWRYWYSLHNHTRQATGALGVPVPSTSDVQMVRNQAGSRGLERLRVTNGFYTFDAAIGDIADFRAR